MTRRVTLRVIDVRVIPPGISRHELLALTLQDVNDPSSVYREYLVLAPRAQWRIARIWPGGVINLHDVVLCEVKDVEFRGETRTRVDLLRRLSPPPSLPEDQEILRVAGWRCEDGLWTYDDEHVGLSTRQALHRMMADSRFSHFDRECAQLYLADRGNWIDRVSGAALPVIRGHSHGPATWWLDVGTAPPSTDGAITRGPGRVYCSQEPVIREEASDASPPASVLLGKIVAVRTWLSTPGFDPVRLQRELDEAIDGLAVLCAADEQA